MPPYNKLGGIMYKKKCLFRNSNGSWGKEPTAIESVWAYLSGIEKKATGRYRIRVTKMSGAELVAMGLAPDGTPPEFFGLQASLDKWHPDQGWLPTFDWVGDPESSVHQIEKDLGKQFQAFVTGISLEDDFSFDLPKAPVPEKNTFKTPKKNPEPEPETEVKPPIPDETPDFDWI
tara:strand:+ start:3927 stop:4451 length:525 start_codon:yes stop_codon:yes gene_type:complete